MSEDRISPPSQGDNFVPFQPRTPKQRLHVGLASMTDDEAADLMLALNRCRTHIVWTNGEERLLAQLMGRGLPKPKDTQR
ncbi:MAG: hypothetical protein AAFR79_08590 [Pseudomonadota bacterium]